jgi:hypothetical protein
MNGPDSISDPVARRLRCTESSPLARGSAWLQNSSAQLGSAQLGSRLMTWQVGPTVLTCQLTGRWHGMPTWHAGVMLMSWWRHSYPGLARGSGQPIRVKKTRVTRGGRLCAWPATLLARDDVCERFWRSISTPFSPVASSLPPLHSGMVNTQFWQLSCLSKNQTPL